MKQFSRTEILLGEKSMEKLRSACVAIFGIGGVGSFTAEALARSGIGHLILIDKDDIDATNINRQVHALSSTVGRSKVEVMRERILEINPAAKVDTVQKFYLPDATRSITLKFPVLLGSRLTQVLPNNFAAFEI